MQTFDELFQIFCRLINCQTQITIGQKQIQKIIASSLLLLIGPVAVARKAL